MSDFLIQFSSYISNIFSPWILILLNIFLLLLSIPYLDFKKISYKEIVSVNCPNYIKGLIMILISLLLSGTISQIIKNIYKVNRPEYMLVIETGYSFISGHTAVAFAMSFMCLFLLFKYFKDHRYYINILHSVFFISLALLISFSRIMLNVHRYIDVIGGFVIGLLSAYLSIKIYYSIIRYVDKKIYK